MPRPTDTDSPDGSGSMPQPELNPLLNPLLAQHMGRWAEVYFTTPPEKREEAVLELIRELQAAAGAAAESPSATGKVSPNGQNETPELRQEIPAHNFLSPLSPAAVVPRSAPLLMPCPSCGAGNAAEQRFCGMCGVPLPAQAAGVMEPRAEHGLQNLDLQNLDLQSLGFLKADPEVSVPQPVTRPVESPSLRAGSFAAEAAPAESSHSDIRQTEFARTGFVAPENFSFAGAFPPAPSQYEPEPGTQYGRREHARDDGKILVPVDAPASHSNRNHSPHGDTYDREIFSLRQSLAGNDYEESDSSFHPYRFRVYAGVVLTILLGILIYMGWRGTQALSTQGLPPGPNQLAQPSANSQTSASHAQPNASTTDGPTNAGPANAASPTSTAQANPAPVNPPQPGLATDKQPHSTSPTASEAESEQPEQGAAPIEAKSGTDSGRPPLQPSSSVQRIPDAPARGNGSEELAVAQGFLNGAPGKSQDAGEAAKWLWKSVAKQNANAALLLSDLYLRGDGVPQSCDQARLLLDAAARKSVAGAAERIRELQTKGCR